MGFSKRNLATPRPKTRRRTNAQPPSRFRPPPTNSFHLQQAPHLPKPRPSLHADPKPNIVSSSTKRFRRTLDAQAVLSHRRARCQLGFVKTSEASERPSATTWRRRREPALPTKVEPDPTSLLFLDPSPLRLPSDLTSFEMSPTSIPSFSCGFPTHTRDQRPPPRASSPRIRHPQVAVTTSQDSSDPPKRMLCCSGKDEPGAERREWEAGMRRD